MGAFGQGSCFVKYEEHHRISRIQTEKQADLHGDLL